MLILVGIWLIILAIWADFLQGYSPYKANKITCKITFMSCP